MRKVFTFLFLTTYLGVYAQTTIPNGDFENWTSQSYENLDDYFTDVSRNASISDTVSTTRSTDRFSGNYSVRLETRESIYGDTLLGFFTSGDFENNGFPYTQSPDSIVGYYKSDVKTGDTAIMILRFSSLGNVFHTEVNTFTGSQSNWTRFAFPIRLSSTPDSMFIGAASSNAINEVGVTFGSWIMLDSLHLVGSGITQQLPNPSFENWSTTTFETPDSWTTTNGASSAQNVYAATKSADSKVGSYALRLETIEVFDDTIGLISNGTFGRDSIVGGIPFNAMADTLVGYYKYTPNGTDTAAMGLTFSKNQLELARIFETFTSTSTYTQFKIPFSLLQAPDTLRIDLVASARENVLGSVLFIDDLRLNSIINSLDKELTELRDLKLYPNPSTEYLSISFQSLKTNIELEIVDAIGRVYQSDTATVGQSSVKIATSSLPFGIYYVRFKVGNNILHKSFIKE